MEHEKHPHYRLKVLQEDLASIYKPIDEDQVAIALENIIPDIKKACSDYFVEEMYLQRLVAIDALLLIRGMPPLRSFLTKDKND